MSSKKAIRDFIIITIGTVIIGVAVYFFMLPSHLTVGSASALALVISNFVPLPVSVNSFIINVFLLIIGYLLIGPEFGIKSIYSSLLLPAILGMFEILFPNQASLTQDPLLDMICYTLVVSIGLTILFATNCSSGGIDVVAKLMNKFLRMDLGQAMSTSGMMVALSSALCYDTKTVILSVIGTYLGGIVLDRFIFGMNPKRRVCVISKHFNEILSFILHDLHSGATIYEGIGAYNNEVRKEIITIVDNQEYKKLMDYVMTTDPDAFVTVYSVQEISYKPKNKSTQ